MTLLSLESMSYSNFHIIFDVTSCSSSKNSRPPSEDPIAMEYTPDRKRKSNEIDSNKNWTKTGSSRVCTTDGDRKRKLSENFSTESWEKISKSRIEIERKHKLNKDSSSKGSWKKTCKIRLNNNFVYSITNFGRDYLEHRRSCYFDFLESSWAHLCSVDHLRVRRMLSLFENCELSKEQLKAKLDQRWQHDHVFWDRQLLTNLDELFDLCLKEKFIS